MEPRQADATFPAHFSPTDNEMRVTAMEAKRDGGRPLSMHSGRRLIDNMSLVCMTSQYGSYNRPSPSTLQSNACCNRQSQSDGSTRCDHLDKVPNSTAGTHPTRPTTSWSPRSIMLSFASMATWVLIVVLVGLAFSLAAQPNHPP